MKRTSLAAAEHEDGTATSPRLHSTMTINHVEESQQLVMRMMMVGQTPEGQLVTRMTMNVLHLGPGEAVTQMRRALAEVGVAATTILQRGAAHGMTTNRAAAVAEAETLFEGIEYGSNPTQFAEQGQS
jgi:hypothetical protein